MYVFDKPEPMCFQFYLLFLTQNLYALFLIYSQAITYCTYIIL